MDMLSGHLLVQELCREVGGSEIGRHCSCLPIAILPFLPLRRILTFVLPALSGQVPRPPGPFPVPGMNLHWSMPAPGFSFFLLQIVATRTCL